jgi:cell division septation protein DedD
MQKIKEQQPPAHMTGPAKGGTAKPKTPAAPPAAAGTKPAATTPAPAKPATPPAAAAVPTKPATGAKAAETTKTVAPAAPPAKPAGNFAIQVASFPDKLSADDLVKKLKADKWDAYSTPTDIPGKGIYYRVYVGHYETKDQADKALLIFKSKETEHQDAFVRKLE